MLSVYGHYNYFYSDRVRIDFRRLQILTTKVDPILLGLFLTLSINRQVYSANTMPGPLQKLICWANIAKWLAGLSKLTQHWAEIFKKDIIMLVIHNDLGLAGYGCTTNVTAQCSPLQISVPPPT